MIVCVFGLPRAGKSTLYAWAASRALRGKSLSVGHGAFRVHLGSFAPYKAVYSNFPIKGCKQMSFDQFGKVDFTDSLCLIDEISLYADSRDFKTFSKTIKEYFALHGHYRNDIFIASQSFGDADKRIRNLAEVMVNVEKRGAFSLVRPIRRSMKEKDLSADHFELCPPLSSKWLWRKPFYAMFDSFDAPPLAPNTATKWVFK